MVKDKATDSQWLKTCPVCYLVVHKDRATEHYVYHDMMADFMRRCQPTETTENYPGDPPYPKFGFQMSTKELIKKLTGATD